VGGCLGTSGRFRHRCREKIFRKPLEFCQAQTPRILSILCQIFAFWHHIFEFWRYIFITVYLIFGAIYFIFGAKIENRVFSKGIGGGWVGPPGPPGRLGIGVGEKYSAHPLSFVKGCEF